MQVQNRTQKVMGLTLPEDADEGDVKKIKITIASVIGLIFFFVVWHISFFIGDLNYIGLAINLLTIFGIAGCAYMGIYTKNPTMLKFLSCCTFYMVFNVILGILLVVMLVNGTKNRCDDCIKRNITKCISDPRNDNSAELDTSNCQSYLLENSPRAIIYIVFCVLHMFLFAVVGVTGCQLSGMRYFVQQKNFAQGGGGQVYSTGAVVVQSQPMVVTGQPMIVQSQPQIWSPDQPQIVTSGQPQIVTSGQPVFMTSGQPQIGQPVVNRQQL
jgi:hypothetical protein